MQNPPLFQVYECQNPECQLRFPTNLSITGFEKCPQCGDIIKPSVEPFSNSKAIPFQGIPSPKKISLLLDNLRSTLNVGSIFRTANGAAVDHIYCCGTTPTPDHAKFNKSGLGAEETIPWGYARNALRVVEEAKGNDFHISSLESSDQATSIFSIPDNLLKSQQILLVVGNEISGVDPGILEISDSITSIPMLGSKTSLNVAIAAAIALYVHRFSLTTRGVPAIIR